MKKLRAAVIGAGMIANAAHIPAYKNLSDTVELVAIASTPFVSAQETAKRAGIPGVYESAEEMLEKEHPDIVSICTPNKFHKSLTLLALSCGAHVICEKPLAMSYADGVEMYQAAEKAGRILVACQSMRFESTYMAAHNLAMDGILGNVYFSELNLIRRRGVPTWGSFHRKDVNGGGAMCDIGVHFLDAMMWIMGNPKMESVTGIKSSCLTRSGEKVVWSLAEAGAPAGVFGASTEMDPDAFETEEFAAGCVRFEGGGLMNFKVSWAVNLPPSSGMSIVGDKAGLLLPQLQVLSSYHGYQADISPRVFQEGPYHDKPFYGHWYLVENVVRSILGQESLCVKKEETLNVLSIIDAFYRSSETGKEVHCSELLT